MKPRPRVKLNGVSSKNQSLQDILGTCTITDEIISVTPVINALHNTRLTLKKPDGEQRVHFYNRLDIANIIPADFRPSGNLQNDIEKLNLLGCDFNEDDLIVSNRRFVALPESLGYYGGIIDRIFTDSIAFGVKNSGGLISDRYSGQLTHVAIAVDGVAHETEIDYTGLDYDWEDPRYVNPTQALINTIKSLMGQKFPTIEVSVDAATWLESRNEYVEHETSGIMTIKNLNSERSIEIAIQAWKIAVYWNGETGLDYYHNILPITRLEKRGTNKINDGKPSMVSLYMHDVVEMNSWWPSPEDESHAAAIEFGKLLQLNGAQGTNLLSGTSIEDRALPEVSLCVPASGVSNVMRVITIGYQSWNDEMPVGHFINLLPQEVKLESFLNYEPLVLGPAPMAGMSDRVFFRQPYISLPDVDLWDTEIVLKINNFEHVVSPTHADPTRPSEAFRSLVIVPELLESMIFTALGDQTNSDQYIYFQNLTDEPMRVFFFWRGQDGQVIPYLPEFILDPADTLKGSYELGPTQNTSEYKPAVAELMNDRRLESITWRGVKTTIPQTYQDDVVDEWRVNPFAAILEFGRMWNNDEEQVIDFLYTTSPFLEEFIFNEGLEDEVKFQLTPMLLTRSYEFT